MAALKPLQVSIMRTPGLAELIPHRSPAEAFWVIQSGVRMTGMPAFFGPTREDEELWALVAFLDRNQVAVNDRFVPITE